MDQSEGEDDIEERAMSDVGGATGGTRKGKEVASTTKDAQMKLDFQNPLFHMPLRSDALKEVNQTTATARY